MICYKCVSVVHNMIDRSETFHSIVTSGSLRVGYNPGQKVTAPKIMAKRGYHLLVFGTLEAAKNAMKAYSWLGIIVPVRVNKKQIVKRLPAIFFDLYEITRYDLNYEATDALWESWSRFTSPDGSWPYETIMVKSLTMPKVIHDLRDKINSVVAGYSWRKDGR